MIYLPDRAVLRLSGQEAHPWLANLVTCDITGLQSGQARWGALLTPQGKILFDFLAATDGQDIYLDTDRDKAGEFAKRLNFYKLRAKVKIEDFSQGWSVHASLPPARVEPAGPIVFTDPRQAALGTRALGPAGLVEDATALAAYHAHRIALGIPEAGKDFAFGEAFPHEALMDMLGGVDFKKGCYVGQEVVSRMHHRGTARTRIVPVTGDAPLPPPGTQVRIGDKVAGTLGSSAGAHGLAMLRLDRVEDGLAQGTVLDTDGIALRLSRPQWWTAPWAETIQGHPKMPV
jgi:folate-binding protein YgfZ